MYRLFALAVVLIAAGMLTSVKAQASYGASSQLPEGALQGVSQEAGKEQIASDELPKAVKQALKNEALKDWNVSEVYVVRATVQQAAPRPVYEVYLTNAEHKRTVARFYKNGKAVSGKNKLSQLKQFKRIN